MRALSVICLILVLTTAFGPVQTSTAIAAPPQPPADFAQPQSPTKPEPFPIKMVDQGQYDSALKGYFMPEGFKLEVVINEPDTINPVGMTFAPDGTLFVMEWRPDPVTGDKWFEVKETFRYRDGTSRQVATMKKFTLDLIKQYKYNPGNGKFDSGKVIIAEELPSSIMYHEGWLYVTGRGTVRRWRQGVQVGVGGPGTERAANPNDPWSIRETVAQGFCGFHHHQVSGLTLGNDGLLYITSGDDDNYVEGSDGSRAMVLRTGAVFRCNPDGSNMEMYSMGYRNPYRDIAYDDKFNFFHSDNDNEDGSRFMGCRIMHVAEGTDFGWRLQIGARCCRPDHTRGAVAGELPGKVPPMLKTGRGAPAGLLIYHDTKIPEKYRGLLYYPDVFRKLIRAYKVAPDGSTFKITNEFEFLKTEDPLFRPCQMVTGPDGAIYICDWRTNSGGAGKLSGDGIHGRIYRVTWVGNSETPALPRRGMDSWAKIQQLPDDKLVEALNRPDLTDRVEARKELVRRGPKARDLVLRKLVSGKLDGDARIPALGVLFAGWNADVEDLCRLLLNDASPDVRRVAVEGLGMHAKPKDYRLIEALMKALADQEPAVRRAGALALGRIGGESAPSALVNYLQVDREGDAFLKDAYLRALERLGKPGIDALLSLASSGDKEREIAIEAFVALRSKAAADALPELLMRPDISTPQREALVRSYTNYQFDPPISLDPLVAFLAKRQNESLEVVRAAVEVFAVSGEANAKKANDLVIRLLTHPDDDVRYVAIKAVEDLRLSAASPQLVAILSDATRRESERASAVRALRVLGDKKAIGPLQTVLTGPHPATLKSVALQALAALDIVAARSAAEKLLDQPDPTLLADAVSVLSSTKAGAKLIGERF
ncbi:MAG TPA: PVC-type heme-binding CxxCH protein, partial [Gemmata sp.]|nr:PVC-type heme-binding CxxCH protein [Gemmata sp.]